MFLIKEVTLSYGAKVLFNEISETIGPRDRIALVGSNGSGKTTLLRLLMGEESPGSGSIEKPDYATVGYLPQDGISATGRSLREEAGMAFSDANALKVKQNEANPPIELIIDKNGFDYAMRKKIRRPRGKILQEDYDRVEKLHSHPEYNSELDDIRFLEKLKNLKYLNLKSGLVIDVSSVAKLANLKALHLQCFNAMNLKAVNKLLKLTDLYIRSNQLQYFSNLKNLKFLHVRSGIDFKQLENYPDLKSLKIAYDGEVEEIKNFSNLQRLEELKLLYNPDKNPPISKQDLENLRNMLPDTKVTLTDRGW